MLSLSKDAGRKCGASVAAANFVISSSAGGGGYSGGAAGEGAGQRLAAQIEATLHVMHQRAHHVLAQPVAGHEEAHHLIGEQLLDRRIVVARRHWGSLLPRLGRGCHGQATAALQQWGKARAISEGRSGVWRSRGSFDSVDGRF